MHLARVRRQGRKRTTLLHQRVELRAQTLERVVGKAGTYFAGIQQRAFGVVHPKQQGAQATAPPLRLGETADDKLLPLAAFELDPLAAAAAPIRRIGALADDAFKANLAGGCNEVCGAGVKRCAEPQGLASVFLHERFQRCAALEQRFFTQVTPRVHRQVKHGVDKVGGGRAIKSVLQALKVRRSVVARSGELAVEPSGAQAQGLDGIGDGREFVGPVVAAPGEQTHGAARVDASKDAVAVKFQLVNPAHAIRWRRVGQRGQLRRQRLGKGLEWASEWCRFG